MFDPNSCRIDNGEERGDRLVKSQANVAVFDALALTDSIYQSFSDNITSCLYHDVDTTVLNKINENIFIIHVNIRSLQKNFHTLLDIYIYNLNLRNLFFQLVVSSCLTTLDLSVFLE